MENKVSTRAVVIAFIVFSLALPFCGALGIYYHAATEGGVVILSAYVFYKRGFTIKQIALIQLPIILFNLGYIAFYQLYHNIALIVSLVLGFGVVPLYILFKKSISLIPTLFITAALVLFVYMLNGWFIYRWSKDPIAENPVSINKVEIVDSENIDFHFPNDDKIYVLELWSTGCGICFKKMPDFELLEQHFAGESRVECLLLNLPVKRDTLNQAKQMLFDRGVHLQSLYAKDIDSWEQLNAEGVPHILLIRNGRLLESHNGRSIKFSNNLLLPDLEERVKELLEEL